LPTRPVFEQKRAEALAASGQTQAAAARALFVAEALASRWQEAPASLDELALAARVARLLSLLGHTESGALAVIALPHARAVGDAPIEAELALRVVESDAPREARAKAADVLSSIALSSGHRIGAWRVEPAGADEPRAPSYPRLRDRLSSLTGR
jgi:hypothetical protein